MNQFNKKQETPHPLQFDLKPHIEAITVLWKSKKKEEKKGFVKTLQDTWNGEEEKRGYEFPFLNKTKEEKSWIEKAVRAIEPNVEPVGVAGVGCGFGFMAGIGVTRGIFWAPGFSTFDDRLKLVFGFGRGCGIGIGFGHGHALGYFLGLPDEPERKVIQTR